MYDKVILLITLSICLIVVDCNDICAENDVDCAEREINNFVKEIDKERKVNLLGDYIVIEKVGDETVSRTNQNLDEIIANFITNHALKFKLPNNEDSIMKAFKGNYY